MGFSAPGFRGAGSNGRLGDLVSVCNDGFSWSSAVSRTDGVFLLFYTQYLYPSGANRRGHGYQLRCLSE
ncbi:hypothetical protein [uncultured Rikenella sp.]|uniref:hypothetical protein n=1 Tax=uncultured Rikenella sp. TaxID=368003 RepID=UPI0025CECEFA|nr:hypothetical protein [uncultured Rikenella sp.]